MMFQQLICLHHTRTYHVYMQDLFDGLESTEATGNHLEAKSARRPEGLMRVSIRGLTALTKKGPKI